jgi:DNA-binding NarL/FixJ family response regulator
MSNDSGARARLRVVVADDDPFTTSLVSDGLRAQGFEVATALTVSGAWELIEKTDPHALVSDLNFGSGESGATLLAKVNAEYPWVGLVVLTSHQSPELAVPNAAALPRDIVYMVKSQLREVEQLGAAVNQAIDGHVLPEHPHAPHAESIVITASQAEVLRMLASGASTRAVAEHRGTTVRAAETMLGRLYVALGLGDDPESNPRVAAVSLWQQGKITVR